MNKREAVKHIDSIEGCETYDTSKRNMIIFRCNAANGNKVRISSVNHRYSRKRIEEAISYAIECRDF